MIDLTNTPSREPHPALNVGDGVTVRGYSDRTAYTVVNVNAKNNRAVVVEDKATLLNGFDSGEPDALKSYPGGFCAHVEGVQRYSYEPDPKGRVVTLIRRRNGRFYPVGSKKPVLMGRSKHYDYNF